MEETGVRLIRASWEIRPKDGSFPIRGDLRALPGPPPRSALVICHGFKGFREWGFFPILSRTIAAAGYAAVNFDFTHNGVGDDGVDFSALDRFAKQTHSRNVDEIRQVLDAVFSRSLFPEPLERVALLGHSRGGAEALVTAAEDDRVSALVTWSAISSLGGRWSTEQIEAWVRGETIHILNARTRQEMPLDPDYWEDLTRNRKRLDVLESARRLSIPWLILHGEADETVDPSDARALHAASGDEAELRLIEGASHTFGTSHPFSGRTREFETAVDTTLTWLARHLS